MNDSLEHASSSAFSCSAKKALRFRLAAAFWILMCSSAQAQTNSPQDEATARTLFNKAGEEMLAGDYATACPRLEESKKLAPNNPAIGYRLAECYDKSNRPASAWTELLRVKPIAEALKKVESLKSIEALLKDLEPRLPKMRIDVPAEVASIPGIEVHRNGVPIGPAQWGLVLPVDLGVYTIEAKAPGRAPLTKQVDVKKAESVTDPPVVVEIESLPVKEEPAFTAASIPPAPQSASSTSGMRVAGIMGIGLGAGGIIAGSVLGGLALSRNAESNKGYCAANDHCNPMGFDLRKEAIALGNGSTGAFIAGGAFLAAGVTLFVLSVSMSGNPSEKSAPSATLQIQPNGARLQGGW